MPPFSSQSALPLPKGWRKVVRARVLHAISVAAIARTTNVRRAQAEDWSASDALGRSVRGGQGGEHFSRSYGLSWHPEGARNSLDGFSWSIPIRAPTPITAVAAGSRWGWCPNLER